MEKCCRDFSFAHNDALAVGSDNFKRPGGGPVDKPYFTSGANTILQDGIQWPASVSLQSPVDLKRERMLA